VPCPNQLSKQNNNNNGHLAVGYQSLEVPLQFTKSLQTQAKKRRKKHGVKETKDTTAEELLMSLSSRTHKEPRTEDESTKRSSHYDRCSAPWLANSLLLLL